MEAIRMNTLERGSQWNFFWRNLEFNFLFHPRHWKFCLIKQRSDFKKYSYTTISVRIMFIQLFFSLNLLRKSYHQNCQTL